MIMRDAIAGLLSVVKDEYIICANGFISRDTFNAKDRPRNFYMLGSMGQASSIGLGLALADPDKKVVVFDGDGNLLMNLGILAMVAKISPKNLVHVVLDNECYDSTGGQPTVSSSTDLAEAARGCGIRNVMKAGGTADITAAFRECLDRQGPNFLLVKVGRDPAGKAPRVDIAPPQIAGRFKKA
ncbi:MAG TPA: thiamine pyrophosphate-dependent enzyme [Candidatus Omnitrophota bacterium]|nr:sulfopyruvate decarboxylase subunit beta [Candidatus Omnitrophota bacterium]HOX09436.1 thiamine pyrophosphate-dependent enzyme [Candidatus Omnitrophota bacterium]HPN65814.1 thiamine pyrophosphate-dependent enzyme [Candidatus Omnitrophota bacterium]HRZ66973.1 thiamine pyrophosphate-dependent enzyme [Candidatus Omnitrophota bacterium]